MKGIPLVTFTLLLLLGVLFTSADARAVRVGVYGNEPMIFMSPEGEPKGFYIDLIKHIASAEGWDISYVAGTRSECVTWLGEGRIDILPGISIEPGDAEYALTSHSILSDWGQMYYGSGFEIESAGDLQDKTVAVARHDRMYLDFRRTLEGLGVDCHFVEVDGYNDALRMVSEGVVNACVVPRLYAGANIPAGLRRSNMVGRSVELRFGVKAGDDRDLKNTLDARIAAMKEDWNSPYYRAQDQWFRSLPGGKDSGWGKWTYVVTAALLMVLAAAIALHRTQVKSKTRELEQEINDRRRAEEALRKSEERFHSLYSKMNEGVCLHEIIFDDSGRAVDYVILDINPSYESILGNDRDSVIGKRGTELFDTDEPPFLRAYADVAATERHTTFDSYFAPARRHFRVSAFSPQPGKVAAIFSDITESKERMEELETSEGKFRILFENAPDAMYLNDLSGILVDGNRAAELLTGYNRQDLIGENVLKAGLIPIEQTLKAANNISLCAQGKPTGPDEFTLIRKDGSQVEVEISTHPVKVDGQTLALGIARDITERKRATKSLGESEGRFRAIYESMGDIFIISDLNGNIQQVNRAAVSLLGYVSKEELIGNHIYLSIAEEDRQRASDDMMRALKVNERIVEKYQFLKKGGGMIACEVDIDILKDGEGNAIGFVTLARDVTERSQEEQALRENVDRYKSLLEGLDEALFRVGLPIGKYDYVSPAVKRVFGYTSEDFLKNPLIMRKLVHPDYSRYFSEMWKDLIHGHIQPSYEYRIIDREDKEKWILQTNRRVFNDAGKVLAIEGIWRDVTEQKQVDDCIRENEVHFRTVFETSSTAIQFYDGNRTLIHANRACLDLFGVSDVQDLRKLNLITGQGTPEEARRRLESGESTKWVHDFDFDAAREKGIVNSQRPGTASLEVVLSPVDIGGGAPDWYLAEIRDVGGQMTIHGELQQAQRLESATRLAKAMAQDFNGLLTGIMGYSEHLAGELAGDGALRAEAEEIKKAAEKAVSRTRQLLTFGRSIAIKSKLLDLNSAISEMENSLRRELGSDKNLVLNLAPSLDMIRADREQLEIVLMHLVDNARDAMSSGGTLAIATEHVDIGGGDVPVVDGARSGHFVRMNVSDTGTGIDEDIVGRIFEPFFTTREGTSGMGLSVVYGSIRQHGGWIEVSSQPGSGTEFRIYFPAQMVQERKRSEQPSGTVGLHGGGERILLVEHDEIVRTMATKVLRDKGYNVFPASSAGEAREAFDRENRQFDLLFCDIALPDMNGAAMSEELRSDNSNLKVLLTSSYVDRQPEGGEGGEGAFPLLEKPYALFDLLTSIRDTLGDSVPVA